MNKILIQKMPRINYLINKIKLKSKIHNNFKIFLIKNQKLAKSFKVIKIVLRFPTKKI